MSITYLIWFLLPFFQILFGLKAYFNKAVHRRIYDDYRIFFRGALHSSISLAIAIFLDGYCDILEILSSFLPLLSDGQDIIRFAIYPIVLFSYASIQAVFWPQKDDADTKRAMFVRY